MSDQRIFYVSPRGDDEGPGDEMKPFATMAGARNAVRRAISRGATGELKVLFHEGLYQFRETTVLDSRDSGNQELSIIYAAFPGEHPVFSSGVEVSGWTPLEEVIEELPDAAKGNIWTAALPKTYGDRIYTLYENGIRLNRSRTKGFVPRTPDNPVTDNYTLHYPEGALRKWPNLDDVELVIRPSYPWSLNILPLAAVDESTCIARTKVGGTYRLIECHHFIDNIRESCWIENVFEGINQPGQWVCDSVRRRLYLWPSRKNPGRITAPYLTELVRVDNGGENKPPVRNISFRNLTFTQGDRLPLADDYGTAQHEWEVCDCGNSLLRFRGVEGCAVIGCSFTDSGGTALRFDLSARKNKITGNTIARMGGTGIYIGGYGPGTNNASRENLVAENTIHHIGEITWHAPAVFVWHSSDNRISSNLIHHTNYNAVVVSGSRPFLFGSPVMRADKNDHGEREFKPVRRAEIGPAEEWNEFLGSTDPTDGTAGFKSIMDRSHRFQHVENNIIENNEIHHVIEIMGDGNAIYLSDTGRGNIVRGNYIHDLEGTGGQQAIRTDAFIIGTSISNNIIHRCNGGGINVKHFENSVTNNIISDIRAIVSSSRLGEEERLYFGYISLVSVIPRAFLCPEQVVRIEKNIFLNRENGKSFYRLGNTDGLLTEEHILKSKVQECYIDSNLYFSTAINNNEEQRIVSVLRENGLEKNGVFADPLFINPDSGDFRLQKNSPAFALGIKQLQYPRVHVRAEEAIQ